MAILALLTGGALSWFASTHPDGLEWSMFKSSGSEELKAPDDGVHGLLASIQSITAFLPDYNFKSVTVEPEVTAEEVWPAVDGGTSLSGIIGGIFTLLLTIIIGFILKKRKIVETVK